jgi:hypothetical protein
MEALDIRNTPETLQITLDKRFFDEKFLFDTVEYLRMEYLAQKVNFDESIEELGREAKRTGWQRNKRKYIRN